MASLDPSILEELPDEGTPFPFTCLKCVDPDGLPARGDMDSELYFDEGYYIRHGLNRDGEYWNKGQRDSGVDPLPIRCARCNRHYCKYKNTKKQIYKLNEYSQQRRGEGTKMITVGLIAKWDDPRDKFHQHREVMQRWKLLYRFLVKHSFITGGIYVREMTTKVSFNGKYLVWDAKLNEYKYLEVPDFNPLKFDPYGRTKFHAHIHAVVDMPTYRKGSLIAFSEQGYKFGLGRISVSYPRNTDSLWQTVHNQAKELAKYLTKDQDCGRQAAFGTFRGFKLPQPGNGKDSTRS